MRYGRKENHHAPDSRATSNHVYIKKELSPALFLRAENNLWN